MSRFSGPAGRRKVAGLTAAQTEAVIADLQRSLDGRRRLKPLAGGATVGSSSSATALAAAPAAGPWIPIGSKTQAGSSGSAAALLLRRNDGRGVAAPASASRVIIKPEDIPKETIMKLHERRLRLQQMANAQANSRAALTAAISKRLLDADTRKKEAQVGVGGKEGVTGASPCSAHIPILSCSVMILIFVPVFVFF